LKIWDFGSIFYALQCQSYISWRKDQQNDSFLELSLMATKFWTYKSKVAYVARTVKVFDGNFSLQMITKFMVFAETRKHPTQVLWILHLQYWRILVTQLKVPEKDASTSRDTTGHHIHNHLKQPGWATRICRSELIWSLDGLNARRTLKSDQLLRLDSRWFAPWKMLAG
jgi:hypothetical protein